MVGAVQSNLPRDTMFCFGRSKPGYITIATIKTNGQYQNGYINFLIDKRDCYPCVISVFVDTNANTNISNISVNYSNGDFVVYAIRPTDSYTWTLYMEVNSWTEARLYSIWGIHANANDMTVTPIMTYSETEPSGDNTTKIVSSRYIPANWDNIYNKPSTFTPSSHTHSISDITNLQTTLDAKANSDIVTISSTQPTSSTCKIWVKV